MMKNFRFLIPKLRFISNGAGLGAENSVGTGVLGGMIAATTLAIYFFPVFFVVIRRHFTNQY